MRCFVRPGRAGICGVRENRDGTLVSTVYGRAVAVGLDPIEKKPLFHVAPGALAYSIATVGCPFHCSFCQNWEIAQAPRLGLDLPTRYLPPSKVVDEALTARARAIAYTYVEPTVFLEYALDTQGGTAPGCSTSSHTATPRRRRSTCCGPSSTPPTSTSSRSTTPSIAASAAHAWHPCSMRCAPTEPPASGSRSRP
jgi:hypothetical protein